MLAGAFDAQALPAPADQERSNPRQGSSEDSNYPRYLPFVDGLRAISIVAVVLYHVGVPGIAGGFVGVDIFFVISGFLIINQIKAGLLSNKFSIFSFYAQRALRILPLYLLVLLLTFAAAPFFLVTPEVYWNFLSSAILAPLMLSNVGFYETQGYFDIGAIEKPLLHTWTLSVEEQFYLVIPILLVTVFRLGNRKFGTTAAAIAIAVAAASLAGAITQTSTTGQNAAFYLPYWRAWEFAAGGLIGPQLVSVCRRLPHLLIDATGWVGVGAIALAICSFSGGMPYPSWNAVLPVAGAALVILSGSAGPKTAIARTLALPPFVAIGLVSYGWYLWHWPILSFLRTARLDESNLLIDGLGSGVFGLALACLSYRYIEEPIRRWRKQPANLRHPQRIVFKATMACLFCALLGGSSALVGYRSVNSFVASRYGIEGRGTLDRGCDSRSGFAQSCFEGPEGILIGDSHASVLYGTFAKRFDALNTRLISLAQGGCGPLLLAKPQRTADRRDDCARLISPFERILARPDPINFAIITGIWGTADEPLLSELISEFDPHTRILLIGPVPMFSRAGLACVVLSDRYSRDRNGCVSSRSQDEVKRAAEDTALRTMPDRFPNVRYVDPMGVFCDQTICRPYKGDTVLYNDSHHLSPAGADELFDAFSSDFAWLAGKN
jgi:peptidoglycan/LPS O-acetylase OafA/YrhL